MSKDVTVPWVTAKMVPTANVPSIIIGYTFSRQHAYSASILAKRATQFEDNHAGLPEHSRLERYEHQAYVIGSVFSAVGFLEATINEVFGAAEDTKGAPSGMLKQLSLDVVTSMAQIWRNGIELRKGDGGIELDEDGNKTSRIHSSLVRCLGFYESNKNLERWSILRKFQFALYLTEGYPYPCRRLFDKQDSLWKETSLLIDLRNYFTHFKTEEITFPPKNRPSIAEKKQTRKLRTELSRRKFKNRLVQDQGSSGLLEDLLSSDCANWAVKSSLDFVSEFCKRTDIQLLDEVRDLILKRQSAVVSGCD
ncbi:MAG: hypothetical protein WAL97_06705 [Halobacteriota archaeon]